MNYQNDNYLSHHGVEGMKWGVRHDPERKGYGNRRHHNQKGQPQLSQREIAKRERAAYKKKKLPKTSLGLLLRNRNLSEAEYRQAKKKIERDRDVYEGFLRDVQNIQKALDIPVNALNSGVKTVKNIDYINTLFGGTSFTDRKSSTKNNKWKKNFEKQIKIVHSDMNLPSLVHSDTEDIDNFLCHYGVLGMKWGVRKAEEASNMYHQTEAHARHKVLDEMYKNKKISRDQYKRLLADSKLRMKTGIKQNKANSKSALAELKKSGRSGDDYYKSVMDQLESNRKGFRDVHTYNKAMQAAGTAGGLAGLAGGALAGKARGYSYKDVYGNYMNNNRAAIEKDIYDTLDKFKLSHSDMNDIDNFLCHYGRKGMKWGQHIFGDEET